mgnify:CR=1 FL=1
MPGQVFRIQDLVPDEETFLKLQEMMKAEGWTSRITRMSWAEFQGTPAVTDYLQAEIEAKDAPKQ